VLDRRRFRLLSFWLLAPGSFARTGLSGSPG